MATERQIYAVQVALHYTAMIDKRHDYGDYESAEDILKRHVPNHNDIIRKAGQGDISRMLKVANGEDAEELLQTFEKLI